MLWLIIKSLIENCELGIRRDANGWNARAKGPFALIALLALVFLLTRFH